MHYNKPPKLPEELADKLINRNLLKGISIEELSKILHDISYYRLKGYLYPYYNDNRFMNNITWEHIWSDYNFDIELRNLFHYHISNIEISLRTNLVNTFSVNYNNNWYCDESLFFNKERFNKDLEELNKHWNRSNEFFKYNYLNKYSNNPPAWIIFETTSFGNLSKFYENLCKSDTKAQIAEHYGFSKSTEYILISWFKHLVYIRNIIAHHNRLFSKVFTSKPVIPKNITKYLLLNQNIYKSDKLLYTILIIIYLLKYSNNNYMLFKNNLVMLLNKYQLLNYNFMGFPNNFVDILEQYMEKFITNKNLLF